MRRGIRRLSSQIFIGQVLILVATMLVGFGLFAKEQRAQLDVQYEDRALTVAQAAAADTEIRECLSPGSDPCGNLVQEIASEMQRNTGATYIVVIDMNRVRHSHPNPAEIGQRIAEPIATLDGRPHVDVDAGSLGRSANGKAPLYAMDGTTMIGEVSAGILESSVTSALWSVLPVYAEWFAVALLIGAAASWLLAHRLKKRTFGLELDEIAKL
ncbi:sensor histidine kinase, partial [Actinospica sp. MGRD01-02]|nr:sensor histidine kinase [Actinospica acidithermotolerans]